jgi:hypothetical protein
MEIQHALLVGMVWDSLRMVWERLRMGFVLVWDDLELVQDGLGWLHPDLLRENSGTCEQKQPF